MESILKLLLIVSIAIIVVTIPSFAQQSVPRLELLPMPSKPDTSLNVIHADRLTMHYTSGGQLLIYEGNAEVTIVEYHIKADRIEYDTDMVRVVATGNVVVRTDGDVIRSDRFEWTRSKPASADSVPE
jgi:lipopolysaccharide assembly outer membrane protein LptD (OstA)